METKNQNSNQYDYILSLCTSPRSLKTELQAPFTNDGYLYATNSFMAVRMSPDKASKTYVEGTTKVGEVYPREETTNQHTITIDTVDLVGALAGYGMYVDARSKCQACHGLGEEECFHCGHNSECETCSGQGVQGEEKPVHMLKFSSHSIQLDGRYFTPQYLNIVALIALVLKQDTIVFDVRAQKAHVEFPEVEIIIMLQHSPK
jgi:hypothetical protein